MKEVTKDQVFFECEDDITSNRKSAVVYFCADWCASCKSVLSYIEETCSNYDDFDWLKVNIQNTPKVVSKYGIKSLPSMLLFKDGVLANKVTSSFNRSDLNEKFMSLRGC